ncbi:MAG: SgcJ/EcaC family oxidoreductase, partial [Granulicella sp.]
HQGHRPQRALQRPPMNLSDEQQIRDIIAAWGHASEIGDLDAQLRFMTDDVVFLTAGNPPMSRADFIIGFAKMIRNFRMVCRSDVQEVTITGDLAVTWNRLSIGITPRAGGETIHRAGDTLTVFRRGDDGQWRISRDANMLGPVS